ncbi:hypothetical protein HPB51_011181 [Rhipicephalus microplus]|uniref:Uncharacterized protein n=1 Tax=Rhipicephalus microplus TaxID=6941 RepID=A0A9J6F2D8_RHIMP|nr:hypothetical protein HPB51_011181 [Rhipicephalus microplus]
MEEMTTVKVAGVALVEEAVAFLVAEYLEAPEVACSAVGDPALVQAVDCLEAGLEAVDLEEMTTAKATGTNSVEDKEVDFSAALEVALEEVYLEADAMAEVLAVDHSVGDLEAMDLKETLAVAVAGVAVWVLCSVSTMESLSHAALLISFLEQLSYLLSGRRGFGDESGLEVGPRRYVFEGGNALSAASDVSFPYGTARLAIVPGGFEREYGGRVEDVENLGNSDTIPYGRPKLSGRKTIVILIRRRRPWSQGGSELEDGGGRWGRPDYDYPSDDQTASERRRARRALLRIVLSKLLLAAARRSLARDGSDEDEGRGSRSEQPWGHSERGWISGWRFGEGSDFGSADSYDGRSSRWTRGGLGGEGGRVLLRIMRPNKGESGGIILLGSGRGPQSGARWSPSENIEGTSGSIPAGSSEESAPISDTATRQDDVPMPLQLREPSAPSRLGGAAVSLQLREPTSLDPLVCAAMLELPCEP